MALGRKSVPTRKKGCPAVAGDPVAPPPTRSVAAGRVEAAYQGQETTMLGSFAFAQPDARVAPTMAQSPGPESVRSSTESLHMTLAQHLDVKESDDTELQALLSRVDGDVPDDDIDEDELALLEAQLGQKDEPTGALAALGAERCRGRLAVPEEADEDGSDSPTPPPLDAPGGPAAPQRPRAVALRECAKHLQTLVTTIEQENTARNKLPTAKGAALVLKLEDAVDRAEQLRQASGESLDGLRAELGDVPYLAEVLEAAVEVARDENLAADPDVVKSLREDVDRCLKKVRRDLRKADGSLQRAQARKARANMRPELPPQRGSGFSERRYIKPKKKLVQTAFGYNARDRVTEDVLVIPERKDGLAVKRPDFMKRAPPPTVSRHNAFQPTSNDLAGLQL